MVTSTPRPRILLPLLPLWAEAQSSWVIFKLLPIFQGQRRSNSGNAKKIMGQLFQRILASVWQNRVLSHFQFAERFCVNTIYREKFNESIWRTLEKHLSA